MIRVKFFPRNLIFLSRGRSIRSTTCFATHRPPFDFALAAVPLLPIQHHKVVIPTYSVHQCLVAIQSPVPLFTNVVQLIERP